MRMRASVASFALLLSGAGFLPGASLSAIVKDPSGGFVAGASVTVQGRSLAAPLQAATDASGRVRFDSVRAGSYKVSVLKDAFDPWERTIAVSDQPVELSVALKLKMVTTTVQVSGRRSPLANSDPNYIALRTGKLIQVYRVNNFVLRRDVGAFTFRSGSFSFLPPVMGQVVAGVFVGDGNFQLKPVYDLAVQHLYHMAETQAVNEDLSAMVVYFSDSTFEEIKEHSELADETPERHEEAFKRVKEILEQRRQPFLVRGARPFSQLERLLNYEDIPNYDAEVLAELYNPAQRGSFRAFVHGKKHSDLRFLLNPSGAMPMLPAAEEVALLNFDPNSNSDGIWYLSHVKSELDSGRAGSKEDHRLIAPEHYTMQVFIGRENLVGNRPSLTASCDLRFRSLADGTRMVKFDLVPDLQVARVAWNGREIPFIQESRKQDGSFYLQMPEPLAKGRIYQVTFEYAGEEILQSRFGAAPPRRVWYPTPAGGASRATYDLTFRIPHGSTVVTVGNCVQQSRDGGYDVSQWVSDVPIAQAVFRVLEAPAAKTLTEKSTNLRLAAYIDQDAMIGRVKTYVSGFLGPELREYLDKTAGSLRLFNSWFGKPAYEGLSVVIGYPLDSLPGVMYVAPPIRMVPHSLAMETYVDESFPNQVALEWWNNTVGPVSFHDAWLSSGFANFSTSLYDVAATAIPGEYQEHWVMARNTLLSPNPFGERLNDAGPVWMGMLNDTYKTPRAGNALAVSKGGYILHMLRSMMWDPKTGDDDFRAMMQDYVKQFANQAVSADDFQTVVEKHMKPVMDLGRNRRMDWFFQEWLYGTDIPSYHMEYSSAPDNTGKILLTVKMTQRGVSPGFAMPVPVFADFGGKKVRVAVVAMYGIFTGDFKVVLPEEPRQVLLNVNHDVLADRVEVTQVK